jgi:hypothetical protein
VAVAAVARPATGRPRRTRPQRSVAPQDSGPLLAGPRGQPGETDRRPHPGQLWVADPLEEPQEPAPASSAPAEVRLPDRNRPQADPAPLTVLLKAAGVRASRDRRPVPAAGGRVKG